MSLQEFFNTFNNTNGSDVYIIDPLNMFKLNFTFNPNNSNVHAVFKDMIDENISPFVQSVKLPDFSVVSDNTATTLVGSVQMHKMMLTPESQSFSLEIINTKEPLLENWIYPWMREINNPEWTYDEKPYTTATVTIDLQSHVNLKYVLNGVRPTGFDTYKPSQDLPSAPTRNVNFAFDFMWVITTESTDGLIGQINGIAKKLVNKAAKSIGL